MAGFLPCDYTRIFRFIFLLIRSKFTFQHNLGPQRSWKQESQIWDRLVEAHNAETHNAETHNVEVMITW